MKTTDLSSRVIELQYQDRFGIYQHQINSYEYFIEKLIPTFLQNNGNINKNNKFHFSDVRFISDDVTPMQARSKHLSYFGTMYATVQQIWKGDVIAMEENKAIARIPIMLRSKYASTVDECEYDPGCYFIVNGQEKVILSIEKVAQQKLFRFEDKAVIYSKKGIQTFKFASDKSISCTWGYNKEIPLFILFRAYGVETDVDICNVIFPDCLQSQEKLIPSIYAAHAAVSTASTKSVHTQKDAIEWIKQNIGKNLDEFLPYTLPDSDSKIRNLCYITQQLFTEQSDRDSYVYKRIEASGELLAQLFNQYYNKMMKYCSIYYDKNAKDLEQPLNVIQCIKVSSFESSFKSALSTGNWGNIKNRYGVARPLERLSYLRGVSELRRIITPGHDDENTPAEKRQIHSSQVGFICVVETPEGENIGLVKNMTMTTTLSVAYDDSIIKTLVQQSRFYSKSSREDFYKIITNGDFIGYGNDDIVQELTHYKLHQQISQHVGICKDTKLREIRVNSDGGRLVRPLFKLPIQDIKYDDIHTISSWQDFILMYPTAIEYVDVEQSLHLHIATSLEQATVEHSHAEIDCSFLLGMTAISIPFCNMNQAPRNSYQYNQAKQAMGLYASNFKKRFDTSNILYHPQIPIVSTKGMQYTGLKDLPNGENVIIAIACFTGYNQEDSMILNKSAVERGLFSSSYMKKYNSTISKSKDSKNTIHTKPTTLKTDVNYETLNERGYASLETSLKNGDAIIGKICSQGSDLSEIYKSNIDGKVDYVETCVNGDGYEMINVRVRSLRLPIIGDKFSTRSGQKFTCGILMRQEDMPFTENGMIPDMIINPNCIPRRMTIGQLLESVVGKIGAIKCQFQDGTPFIDRDIREIGKELEMLGYDGSGGEYMYSGITGEKFPNKIFIGPVYCQRLKHMVADKIHARATGSCQLLTRQPPEGRVKNGGLRFGEMERDCAIAHGMGVFLKERMMECSDKYSVEVCKICGLVGAKDKGCCGKFIMNDITMPYSYKILSQELMAINIASRIYNPSSDNEVTNDNDKSDSGNDKSDGDNDKSDGDNDNIFRLTRIFHLLPDENETFLQEKAKALEGTCVEKGFIEKIYSIEEITELPLVAEDLSCAKPYRVVISCSLFCPIVGMELSVSIVSIQGSFVIGKYKNSTLVVVNNTNSTLKIGDKLNVKLEAVKIIDGSKHIRAIGSVN